MLLIGGKRDEALPPGMSRDIARSSVQAGAFSRTNGLCMEMEVTGVCCSAVCVAMQPVSSM